MPWIQLTNQVLWWCGGNEISGYYRSDPITHRNRMYRQIAPSDFCKFVVRDEYIVSGHR